MAEEDEGTQSGATGGQSGTGESDSNDASGETGAQGGAEGTSTEETVPKSQLEKIQERMRAADQRAGKAEAELAQIRDKDMPALEKANRDLVEAQKRVETLEGTNRELTVKLAFLQDNTHKWHNPERALKLVDLSKVEIGEDGAVTGMKDAINALAKSDPYLINSSSEDNRQSPPGTAAGNNGSGGGNRTTDDAKLARRLPVLNSRVRRSN